MRVSATAAIAFVACNVFGLAGCAGTVGEEPGGEIAAEDTSAEYSTSPTTFAPSAYAIRADTRTCAAPACGGFYIRRLNATSTRCPDNVYRTECYVPGADIRNLSLTTTEANGFLGSVRGRSAIVIGSIVIGSRSSIVIGSRSSIVIGSRSGIVIGSYIALSEVWTSTYSLSSTSEFYKLSRWSTDEYYAEKLNSYTAYDLGPADIVSRSAKTYLDQGGELLASAPRCAPGAKPKPSAFFTPLYGSCAQYYQGDCAGY